MKGAFKNTGYYATEAKNLFTLNTRSNVLSLVSTAMIFFILSLVIGGGFISQYVAQQMLGEADLNVYLSDPLDSNEAQRTKTSLEMISGVVTVTAVEASEAYGRMQQMLGEDAQVLSYFEANPFEGFFEVTIELSKLDTILVALNSKPGVSFVRDNRETLERLAQLGRLVKNLGAVVFVAVGVSALVIVSHLCRQAVHQHEAHMMTLYLLGAPRSFIITPFYILGVSSVLIGASTAVFLAGIAFLKLYEQFQGPLPFVPLPEFGQLMVMLGGVMLITALVLGVLGSYMGTRAAYGTSDLE
jgi:cell division transport system permease protein